MIPLSKKFSNLYVKTMRPLRTQANHHHNTESLEYRDQKEAILEPSSANRGRNKKEALREVH